MRVGDSGGSPSWRWADGDYAELARLRPIVAERRQLLIAHGASLIEGGFPLLPTLDAPHWTVALAAPTPELFGRVRAHFEGPIPNPAYSPNRAPLR